MRFPTENELKSLRERYPAGTLLRLICMADDPNPVPPGMIGEVAIIDDAGNIHMKWQGGRGLALIEGVDSFEKLPTCPKCGKQYAERPALSRDGSGTAICPMCGYAEAVAFLPEEQQKDILTAIADAENKV